MKWRGICGEYFSRDYHNWRRRLGRRVIIFRRLSKKGLNLRHVTSLVAAYVPEEAWRDMSCHGEACPDMSCADNVHVNTSSWQDMQNGQSWQHSAPHGNTLPLMATICPSWQHPAPHGSTLPLMATLCLSHFRIYHVATISVVVWESKWITDRQQGYFMAFRATLELRVRWQIKLCRWAEFKAMAAKSCPVYCLALDIEHPTFLGMCNVHSRTFLSRFFGAGFKWNKWLNRMCEMCLKATRHTAVWRTAAVYQNCKLVSGKQRPRLRISARM